MTLDDGTIREEFFPSRYLAELFVSLIPTAADFSEEFAAVRSAIISPVVVPPYRTPKTFPG